MCVLYLSLSGGDSLDGEASLGVVQEAEVLSSLLEGDNIFLLFMSVCVLNIYLY